MVIILMCFCGVNMLYFIYYLIVVYMYNKIVFNVSFNYIYVNRYFYLESVCEVNILCICFWLCKFFEVYGLFSYFNWCSLDFMVFNL